MIKDIFFMAKMILLTALVCMGLQVKVGEKTLDHEFYSWVESSVVVDYIQTAIDGGISITKTGYKQVHLMVTGILNKYSKRSKKDTGFASVFKRHQQKEEDASTEMNLEDTRYIPKVNSNHRQVR